MSARVWPALLALALVPGLALAAEPQGRVLRLQMPAPSLREARRDVRVYLPASYDAPGAAGRRYPVVYLLHGFPGGNGDWFGRAHAAESADTLIARGHVPEIILVCPDGNRGFFGRTLYANAFDGSFAMEDFMTRDLVKWTDSTYRTLRDPEHRAVIGLSDGGTGAINLALRHPDVFGAAASHSGEFRWSRGFELGRVVGSGASATARLAALSPLEYLRAQGPPREDPLLYFDCGTSDESLAQNRELDLLLKAMRLPHVYKEFPGTHEWGYWRAHFPQSLVAMARRWG